MRQSTYESRQRTNVSTFGSFTKTVRNAMNANKKDDDFGYANDIQGRRGRKKGFLASIANTNPVFLIIASAFCVILFMVAFVWIASSLFSSSSTSSTTYTPKSKAWGNKRNKRFANLDSQVSKDIDNVLRLKKQSMNGDVSIATEQAIDEQMSKLINGCLSELPFQLDFNAKSTFDAHVSYVFSSLSSKEQIYLSKPNSCVITDMGTIFDTSLSKSPKQKYAKCSLVKELLIKAEKQGLLMNDPNKFKAEDNTFDKTNQDEWWANQDLFKDHDESSVAYEIIQLSKAEGEGIHLAKQLMPIVLNEYCPNIYQFYDKLARENPSPNTDDKDPKFECVNSLQDLISQIHQHGNIHLSKHEIPAFDKKGNLVAVDKFSLKPDQKFENEWVSCTLLDRIVYYHNVDIEQQVKVLIDQVRDNNYYAFENQADVYMYEHCSETVTTLKGKKAAHDQGDMYISVFRGELTAFAHRVATGEYIGETRDLDQFVVTNNGGIMHKAVAVGQYTECKLIKEIAKQSVNYAKNNQNQQNQQFDENQFNPDYHNAEFDKFSKELHHNEKFLETDAQTIVNHAIKNDDQYELRHLITNMGYLYHASDCIATLQSDKIETVVSEIIQYIDVLIEMKSDTFKNGIKKWPTSHVAAFDCENGRLLLLSKDDQSLKSGNKVISQLFTKVFKLALESERETKQQKQPNQNDYSSQTVQNNGNQYNQNNNNQNQYNNNNNQNNQYNNNNNNQYQYNNNNNNGNQYNNNQNQYNSNSNNNNNEIRSYVTVLLNDISKQRDMNVLQNDIESDLRHYCGNMMNGLTSRARRKFISKLLTIVKGEDRQRINDPIVNEDGFLKSSYGVDTTRERIYKCAFLTELITQKLQ